MVVHAKTNVFLRTMRQRAVLIDAVPSGSLYSGFQERPRIPHLLGSPIAAATVVPSSDMTASSIALPLASFTT